MRLLEIWRYPVKSLRGEPLERARVERQGLEADRRFMLVTPQGQFITARENPRLLTISALATEAGISLSHAERPTVHCEFPDQNSARAWVSVWSDDVPARLAPDRVNRWLSALVGGDVRLAYLADTQARPVSSSYAKADDVVSFADGFPLLLTNAGSLADLNQRIAERRMSADEPLSMRRFRPNVVIDGASAWDEDTWRLIRIGSVTFRVVKPCERCILTTRDPETGERAPDNEPIRTLGAFHRAATGAILFGQNLIPIHAGQIGVGDTVEVIERGPSPTCA